MYLYFVSSYSVCYTHYITSVRIFLLSYENYAYAYQNASVKYEGLGNLPKYMVGSMTATIDRTHPNDHLQVRVFPGGEHTDRL